MKKVLGLLLTLLLLCSYLLYANADSDPSTITIAFFNTLHFGYGSKDCKGDLSYFAEILGQYDIIGLAEVMKNSGKCYYPQGNLGQLDALEEALEAETRLSWSYEVSPRPLGRGSYKEYYAIFYDEKVQTCSEGRFVKDPNKVFERKPYYASFRAGNFDFTLMIFHAKPDAIVDEIPALKDAYSDIQAADPYESDVILMGDFNVKTSGSSLWSGLRSIYAMKRLINVPTTIGKNGLTDSFYDTCWIQSCYSGWEFTGNAGAYQFWGNLFPNLVPSEWHNREGKISDHLPIWARFRIDLEDDDGRDSVRVAMLADPMAHILVK